jgi:transcriptional antiterminator NusG
MSETPSTATTTSPPPAGAPEARWYAIQTYAGHERKVERLIRRRIEEEPGASPEEKEIQDVLVPTQETIEIRGGKRVTVTRRLYPGYVLVRMVYNERTAQAINSVPGVIKFLGTGQAPQPLTPQEVDRLFGRVPAEPEEEGGIFIPFTIGQAVEVVEGPFKDFTGTVQEIDPAKGKVRVEVSLFGRPTSLELDYTQLKGL